MVCASKKNQVMINSPVTFVSVCHVRQRDEMVSQRTQSVFLSNLVFVISKPFTKPRSLYFFFFFVINAGTGIVAQQTACAGRTPAPGDSLVM